MCDSLLAEQTPKRLLECRSNLYELLVHAIPPRTIIKTMVDYLVTRVDESLKAAIVEKAAFYELRVRNGNKAIFHLEAFVVAVMTMVKSVSRAQASKQKYNGMLSRASFPRSSTWGLSGMSDRLLRQSLFSLQFRLILNQATTCTIKSIPTIYLQTV